MTKGKPDKESVALQNRVYDELRRSLMQGVFAPGEKVSFRRLATELGTSIMPVRAAVNKLIAEYALEKMPNRTIMVPEMSQSRLVEIAHWRMEMESHAAAMACEHITEAGIKKLIKINDEMIRNYEDGDWDSVLSNNYKFHFRIYEAAQSEILYPMIESLWLMVGPFTYFALPSPNVVWNAEYHLQLIEALRSGDQKMAAKAMRNDIKSVTDFLLENNFQKSRKLRKVTV